MGGLDQHQADDPEERTMTFPASAAARPHRTTPSGMRLAPAPVRTLTRAARDTLAPALLAFGGVAVADLATRLLGV